MSYLQLLLELHRADKGKNNPNQDCDQAHDGQRFHSADLNEVQKILHPEGRFAGAEPRQLQDDLAREGRQITGGLPDANRLFAKEVEQGGNTREKAGGRRLLPGAASYHGLRSDGTKATGSLVCGWS